MLFLKRCFLFLLAIAMAFISGCNNQKDYDRLSGFPAEDAIWDTLRIPVCWENPNAVPHWERDLVREAIRSSWERWSKVRFIDWDQCSNSSRDGVRIVLEDAGPRTLGLGKRIKGKDQGLLLNHVFSKWNSSCASPETKRIACIKSIAIHEFGHILGFAHEHNRDDTPESCTDHPQGSDGSIKIGAWDLHSVMNYCNPEYVNRHLSKVDILTVQYYYGAPNTSLKHFNSAISDGSNKWDEFDLYVDAGNTAVVSENFKINIHLVHENLNQLEITIRTPQGTLVKLHSKQNQRVAGVISGVFPDTLKPVQPLTRLRNERLKGIWKLYIRDQIRGKKGILKWFGINDYVPAAYLVEFATPKFEISPNLYNSSRDEEQFYYQFQLVEPIPIAVDTRDLMDRIEINSMGEFFAPDSLEWVHTEGLKVGIKKYRLKPVSRYTMKLKPGRLSGFYRIAKSYEIEFTTPKALRPPPLEGFKGESLVNAKIPDNDPAGITSELTMEGDSGYLVSKEFKVYLDIDHPYWGDLKIVLISPKGTQVILHNGTGSSDAGFKGYFPTDYKPFESLDKLITEPLAGKWQIKVYDNNEWDRGFFNSWRIEDPIVTP